MKSENQPFVLRPCVSVVLPMYKVAAYLDKCIRCLRAQTLKNIEMIFVDDCGPDDSAAIVERYAKEDSRIKLVRNVHNIGAGASRNAGIAISTGEYVAFVDPDDWMTPDFYERLYNESVAGDYDIAIGERLDVVKRENGEVRCAEPQMGVSILGSCASGLPLYSCFIHGHQAAIYKLDMVRSCDARYAETSFGECGLFLLISASHAKRFCCVSGAYYYYLQHADSGAHLPEKRKYESELKSIFEQIDYAAVNLPHNRGYTQYLSRKFGFLLWRVNELIVREPEHGYLREYLAVVQNKMKQVPGASLLRKGNRRLAALFAGHFKWFIFLMKHERQLHRMGQPIRLVKRILRAVKRSVYPQRFSFGNREISCLRSGRGTVYFGKAFLEKGGNFAQNFLSYFLNDSDCRMDTQFSEDLYSEYLSLASNGELCWKYARRLGHISKSTIYLDGHGKMRMRGEIVGECGPVITRKHILLPQPDRLIIEGDTLKDYIDKKGCNVDEVYGELVQFLDFVFEKYATENANEISGIAFDARPCNCILKKGHVYELFDFEYEYRTNLDRGFFIYLATLDVRLKIRERVYFLLCEHFHVEPNREKWRKMISQGWLEIIAPTCQSRYL